MSWDMLKDLPKFPRYQGMPEKVYAICSTERSGSTLLSRKLWETGEFGAPFEFFNADAAAPIPLLEAYANYTSPNGVWGVKVHWKDAAKLKEVIPEHYIHVTREDLVAQAISLVIAEQTGQWTSFMAKQRQPVYDFKAIRRKVEYLKYCNGAWETYFQENGIKPLRLVYEKHLEKPGTFPWDEVCDFFGVTRFLLEPYAMVFELPELQRQSGLINLSWHARYMKDCMKPEVKEEHENCAVALPSLSDEAFLDKLFPGKPDAKAFARSIFTISHIWDDLIDQDKPITDAVVNAGFIEALLVLPRNSFYRQWFDELQPLLGSAVTDFLVSMKLEATGSRSDQEISFITRSAYATVIQHAMTLACGWQHALEMAPVLRQVIHQEGFSAYCNSLKS